MRYMDKKEFDTLPLPEKFETNRWICYIENTASLCNGNGWKRWSIVLRKVCGNGDDGVRYASITALNKGK